MTARNPGPFRLRYCKHVTAKVYGDDSGEDLGPSMSMVADCMTTLGAKKFHRWLGRAIAWMEKRERKRIR